jgi:integrase
MQLHTVDGARKYLTAGERDAFLRAAGQADRTVRTLCMTLAYAGCRLSETLALTADRVDLAAGVLVFESLKKRRSGVYRAVPVPPALLDALDLVHGIREHQARRGQGGAGQGSVGTSRRNAGGGRGARLWPWSRMTVWRAVHAVMEAARLDGPHASPKGLRHGFGVAADAVGAEEQDIARRMWG